MEAKGRVELSVWKVELVISLTEMHYSSSPLPLKGPVGLEKCAL